MFDAEQTEANVRKEKLEKKIGELEILLADNQGRMPAHSAKPTIMKELFNLQDQFDQLKKEYQQLLEKVETQ